MGKKGTKRKTRWRVLPIGEDGGSGSGNEEEGECENVGGTAGTYARATQQQRTLRRPNNRGGNQSGGGYYNKQQYHHNTRPYNHSDGHQPLVTTEKQIFNEEEYTKITTPRQDVLFKKGYLGRKRPTAVTPETCDLQTTPADVTNGHYHPSAPHNEGLDNDPNEMMEEQPQFIYTNGFVDQSGVYYINGSGYEIFDPYSGQVTVVVGPHYGPNGGPPVLAAVPCQPVPLQPLEWFNPPGFLPYVTAPCHNGLARDRRKRYSTDSQNCSPQSSESTGPPGSPQESDEVALNGGPPEGVMYHPHHPPPPPYVYPGYMFGAPMYSMNGVTVQTTPNAAPSSDVGAKRRKKKRRRRRRRNGAEDGSEESSSEDKDHEEEPMSVTSQESSLESDSKLSNSGEAPRPAPSDAYTQTAAAAVVDVAENEEVVEFNQRPTPDLNDATIEPVVTSLSALDVNPKPPLVNGCHDPEVNDVVDRPKPNGVTVHCKEYTNKDVVNGDRLVNGNETKAKGEKKKGKKVNGLTNGGVVEDKPCAVVGKQLDDSDDFVFQDDSFLYTQEFINGNVKVEVDEESEWITVKGHKGSQGKRSDSARYNEENKKFPSELTNGHAKTNRDYKTLNGVCGRDKVQYNKGNNTDKLNKSNYYCNGKIEEKCTYTKLATTTTKQSETGNKEKTQFNGKARLLNGTRMDGNEKEDDSPTSRKEEDEGEEVTRKVSVEKQQQQQQQQQPESQKDVPKRGATSQDGEEVAPTKPSRKERKSQKNASPPKTPEASTLTATAKPFEMPTVSLRPETFAKQGVAAAAAASAPKPDHLSREDSLLAALTVNLNDSKVMQEIVAKSSPAKEEMPNRETKKTSPEMNKKGNNNSEKKRKSQQSQDVPKEVGSLKELSRKSVETKEEIVVASVRHEVAALPSKSPLKDTSKEFLEQERRRQDDIPKTETYDKPATGTTAGDVKNDAPIPPPRRKKGRSAGKVATDSTDESSSSSSSQESEESVIECLSSGFNSPKVKVSSSGFSSDDEDIIYQGNLDERDPKALKRISESQEDSTSLNGKALKRNNSSKRVILETKVTPVAPVSKEVPTTSVKSIKMKDKFNGIYKSEEHLKNVQKMAQEIVDSVIEEAMKETVRLKYQKDNDPVKLGITDAVTRWLRSQSPDVLSLPRNEDSESDLSEELEADAEENPDTGSKNLKSNPLPAPSVENITNQLNHLVGDNDGMGRRVANIISEKHDLKESRNDTPDLEDDAISNESVSCGEWDLWDCQHSFAQNYDEMLNKSRKKHNNNHKNNTKNTNEENIISTDKVTPRPVQNSLADSPPPPLVLEYLGLPAKYDPLANDTFSPIENTILTEVSDPIARCTDMCDPALSVAKYYVLGPRPGAKTLSPVEDLECSDSDDSRSLVGDNPGVSLAEELARLELPLPESWAVEPIRVERPRRCASCHCQEVDAAGEENAHTRKREGMSVFKRKLVGRLKGEGAPFPCGGICCILQ